MHCTRLPFWTELNFWVLPENKVADFRPEKAFTEEDSEGAPTQDEAPPKATGATTVDATADAIATDSLSLESALESKSTSES
jgi:hypothetical protein